jgi:hypothetical protein
MAVRGYELYFRVLPTSLMSERSERVRDIDNTKKYNSYLYVKLYVNWFETNC